MPNIAQEICTAALKEYQQYDFVAYETDDHILVLEHRPCGFRDKFIASSVRIEALQNDCKDHLTRCPFYKMHEQYKPTKKESNESKQPGI